MVFTDEQYEALEPVKQSWLRSQWKPNYQELLGIFPEAPKIIKNIIKADKERLYKIIESQRNFWNRQNKPVEKWFWEIWDQVFYEFERQELIKRIRKYEFVISPVKRIAGGNMKEAAKAIPIESLYDGELRRSGERLMGKCELHKDDTASFHIYMNTNSWYCFAESRGGDGIDYVMAKYQIGFNEAVRRMLRR